MTTHATTFPSTRRTRYPDGSSGRIDLRAQPGVIRHALVSAQRPDVRSLQLSLEHANLRIAIEVPDPAALIAALQDAMGWLATGAEPAAYPPPPSARQPAGYPGGADRSYWRPLTPELGTDPPVPDELGLALKDQFDAQARLL